LIWDRKHSLFGGARIADCGAGSEAGAPILQLEDLHISYGHSEAVRGISLEVGKGEILGIVGESGSGKSTVQKSVCGLLGSNGSIDSGRIVFEGRDITNLPKKELTSLRGSGIAYIFQDPTASLDPLFTIKNQFDECIRTHRDMNNEQMLELEVGLLAEMGFDDPVRVLSLRPFNLSGGMCQRVVLAMGLACGPKLLLADEPTSALDTAAQMQVVESMMRLRDEHGVSIMIVSHNIGLVAKMADRIGVMRDGELLEMGSRDEVLHHPKHSYTRELISAVPKIEGGARDASRSR
jgi:peptide/nickel transport system ATP-binding protein